MDICDPLRLIHLPDLLLDKIFSYLSFDEISNLRIVCSKFNEVNKSLLNRGFRRVERFHSRCLKEVKSELPRRESERRDHILAPLCNILSGIETRFSLLNMTFLKYMDANMCCFIPGKVIDEIYRVLYFVQREKAVLMANAKSLFRSNHLEKLRANVILKELRDISSMAMEHFEEKILPGLKAPEVNPTVFASPTHLQSTSFSMLNTSSLTNASVSSFDGSPVLSYDQFNMFYEKDKSYRNNVCTLKKKISDLQAKMTENSRKMTEQDLVIQEISRLLSEQTSKFAENETKIADANKKIAENDNRLSQILDLITGCAEVQNSVLLRDVLKESSNWSSSLVNNSVSSLSSGNNVVASTSSSVKNLPSSDAKVAKKSVGNGVKKDKKRKGSDNVTESKRKRTRACGN